MNIGYARNTADNQLWLNATPAVTLWTEQDDNWIEFQFDADIKVSVMPAGVYFDKDQIGDDEPDIEGIDIDFGALRSCLQQRGADTDAVLDWFDSSVDEQATMRRAGYDYVTLAEILDRCYRDEREADTESKANEQDSEY